MAGCPTGLCRVHCPSISPGSRKAFRRAGNGNSLASFEIQGSVHVAVSDDVKAALAALKPEVALYVGGMGHRDKNFHKDIMVRRGHRAAAERIQELYLAGRKAEAPAAVPDEWVDHKSLVGPAARIKQRYCAWADAGLTGLTIRSKQPQAIEVIAEAAGLN
jgi:Luciferase-like monooxygenase